MNTTEAIAEEILDWCDQCIADADSSDEVDLAIGLRVAVRGIVELGLVGDNAGACYALLSVIDRATADRGED